MQLVTMENHLEIVPQQFFSELSFMGLSGIINAIKNTVHNWDIVLFLLATFVIVFGSIIVFLCSIKKIFKFQSKMEFKAREEIRKRKMLKHRHLIQQQKSIELEANELDTQIDQQVASEKNYDIVNLVPSHNLDDKIFNYPEPDLPPPEINDQNDEIHIDYSSIDVPDSFDMWPTPPEPLV